MKLIGRLSFEKRFELIRFAAAIGIAVLLSFLIILFVSKEPLLAFSKLFLGPLESARRFGNVLELCIPLSFTGLAVAVMFSADMFNMGAEGAFYVSGAVAVFTALLIPLPPVIAPLVSIIIGGLCGAVVCWVPAFLKQRWNANELVSSLMLNYVFFYITKYFANTTFKDPSAGFMATYLIPANAKLARLIPGMRLHFGLLILCAVVVLTVLFIRRTAWGYRLMQTGRNIRFARYAGLNTTAIISYSQLIGGFIAGVGGSVEVLGMYDRFQWQSLPGYGFDGIVVAILAKNKPHYIPIAAFFLAYLKIGADKMATSTDVTAEMVLIIQGVIIMLAAAQAFLSKWRQKALIKMQQESGLDG